MDPNHAGAVTEASVWVLVYDDPKQNSHKFYNVYCHGTRVVTHWGRIGTNGQWKSDEFRTWSEAFRVAQQAVRSKKGRGYIETACTSYLVPANASTETLMAEGQLRTSGKMGLPLPAASTLAMVIEKFADWNRKWGDPLHAADQCGLASESFVKHLNNHNMPGATIVSGFRFEEWEGQKLVVGAHMAVLYEDRVYDWTARQFDRKANFPRITTLAEFHAEWPALTQENF